jgi:iron complex transport system substrate-binding protein
MKLRVALVLAALSLLTVLPVNAQSATPTVCQSGYRLFEHDLLATDPVCIPENPKRIVALDLTAAELTLFTDQSLVGTFDWIVLDLGVTMPELKDDLADVTQIGWPANLETILALKPDLIASYTDDSLVYDELSAIAPTVTLSKPLGDWRVSTEFWSDVFNVPDVYAQMQSTYKSRVEALQTALGPDRGDVKVSVVHSSPYFTWFPLPDSPQGRLLSDVGLGRPEAQSLTGDAAMKAYGSTESATISDETLNLVDGDVILLFSYANDDPEIVAANQAHFDELEAKPVWKSLKAVQEGHVCKVGPQWYRAASYLVVNRMIDDLFTCVAHIEPTIPDPIAGFANAAATPEAIP